MVEQTAAALAEGQSVIIFPEGTRTTPGQALQFHRGAANIAVKAALIVTPVFIRCDPTTLAKNMPWYRIPPRRVRFTFRVGADIDMAEFRNAPAPMASRALNECLLEVFEGELAIGRPGSLQGRPARRV
jgi:1-acyl-sn-glycerol-3-phosphate acyltransferase